VGHFYAELKICNAALLLIALGLAIGWLPLLAKVSLRWQAVCRGVLCLAALGTAITMAGLDFSAAQNETERNPYGNFLPGSVGAK